MTQSIDLKLSGDEAWPELLHQEVVELPSEHLMVAFLDNGTIGGNPTVLVRADKDGVAYIIEFTGKSFQALAGALRGKYGIID